MCRATGFAVWLTDVWWVETLMVLLAAGFAVAVGFVTRTGDVAAAGLLSAAGRGASPAVATEVTARTPCCSVPDASADTVEVTPSSTPTAVQATMRWSRRGDVTRHASAVRCTDWRRLGATGPNG